MAEAKLIFLATVFCVLASCSPRLEWEKFSIDGHRTGVVAITSPEAESFVGTMDSTTYISRNGNVFDCGITPAVAKILLDAQPSMESLKEVLAYSPEAMTKKAPECPLSNWTVDNFMIAVESLTHKKVDLAIANFGGIRVDMPQGTVLVDDIVSMFPFNNHFCYLTLKGSDIRAVFETMAATLNPQPVGGARFVVRDGRVEDITVGGKPLDDRKLYGLATIDFLLDGGDNLYLAKNARELIVTDLLVRDWFIPYLRKLTENGGVIEYKSDGRIKVL